VRAPDLGRGDDDGCGFRSTRERPVGGLVQLCLLAARRNLVAPWSGWSGMA
jgi:hypothetical protein